MGHEITWRQPARLGILGLLLGSLGCDPSPRPSGLNEFSRDAAEAESRAGEASAGTGAESETPLPAAQETPPRRTATLEVVIEGVTDSLGFVSCALFDNAQDFSARTHPVRSARLAAQTEACRWVVQELPVGRYSLAIYHDRDENGKLTKSALGIPQEPYAFSNQDRLNLRPPSFEKACFELADNLTLQLQLRSLIRP